MDHTDDDYTQWFNTMDHNQTSTKSDSSSQQKRMRHNSDSGNENDFDCDTSIKKIRRPIFVVRSKEMSSFLHLLDDAVVYDFLTTDSCKKLSDKYLLAMVFAYFKRAGFAIREYSRTNFFVALFLANDMEEDEEDKYEIFPWALGKGWNKTYSTFLKKRETLWARIQYRAVVSRKCCEEVISIEPEHWAWGRERPDCHAGAIRAHLRHDDDGYPRGPLAKPRPCVQCANHMEYDSASPCDTSWYLSSSEDSSPEALKSTRVIQSTRFNMAGLKKTLPSKDDSEFWTEEE